MRHIKQLLLFQIRVPNHLRTSWRLFLLKDWGSPIMLETGIVWLQFFTKGVLTNTSKALAYKFPIMMSQSCIYLPVWIKDEHFNQKHYSLTINHLPPFRCLQAPSGSYITLQLGASKTIGEIQFHPLVILDLQPLSHTYRWLNYIPHLMD